MRLLEAEALVLAIAYLAAAVPVGGIVLAAIDGGAQTPDEILRATGLAAYEVAAALTELELSALVSASAGVYRR